MPEETCPKCGGMLIDLGAGMLECYQPECSYEVPRIRPPVELAKLPQPYPRCNGITPGWRG